LKALFGFWTRVGNGVPRKAELRYGVDAHVGIDRITTTAAERILYTLETISELAPQPINTSASTVLIGTVDADDSAISALRKLLASSGEEVTLGHARTRGYGRIRLSLSEDPLRNDEAAEQTATARWEFWNCELMRFLNEPPVSAANLDPGRHFFFSLSLPTGAILVDRVLRYSHDLADAIAWLPRLPRATENRRCMDREGLSLDSGGNLRCVTAVTRAEPIRGWNAAQGLPKRDEWGLARGSVFAYLFDGSAQQRGALLVSDPFHHDFHRQET